MERRVTNMTTGLSIHDMIIYALDKATEEGKHAGMGYEDEALAANADLYSLKKAIFERLTELEQENATLRKKLDKYLLEEEIDAKLYRNTRRSVLLMKGEITLDEYKNRFEE